MNLDQAMQMAIAHHQSDRLAEAEKIYRQVLSAQPDHAEALHLLGVLAGQAGHRKDAIDLIRRAIALRPDHFEAYNNLGNFLVELDRFDEAIDACNRAIQINPGCAGAYNNLGNALWEMDRADEALAAFDRALALGLEDASVHVNRGTALAAIGRKDEAVAAFRRAIELDPNLPVVHHNLGHELMELRQFDEALSAYRKAVQLNPTDPVFHWSLALALLSIGQFSEGWNEFEWRLKHPGVALGRDFLQPQWNGEDLRGKTLLLHGEAGYGDALQFIRYVPLLQNRGGKLLLECWPPLAPLFADLPGVDAVIPRGQPLPPFDFHIALPSLPRLFKTDLTNIPNSVPYLKAPPDYLKRWTPRVQGDGLKVGLVWAGASQDRLSKGRGMRADDFLAALSQVNGVQFFTLQKGPAAKIPKPSGMQLIDFTDDLHDFADTAAVIQNLDLIISVDTSVAHLAGALARPVWVLLPFAADFRWLLDRTDSPWYPTMRLFRPIDSQDALSPLSRVISALKEITPNVHS